MPTIIYQSPSWLFSQSYWLLGSLLVHIMKCLWESHQTQKCSKWSGQHLTAISVQPFHFSTINAPFIISTKTRVSTIHCLVHITSYGFAHPNVNLKVFLSVQNGDSWDQFSHRTKKHNRGPLQTPAWVNFYKTWGAEHVQQQPTWMSGGSKQQNNKQTKVCRSLTGFIVHGWAPLRQTKKTSKKKYGDTEISRGKCSVHASIPKHSPSADSFWPPQIRISSLNRYGPGVIIPQPHWKTP